ncbi:hypothetical protein [Kribbella sp. NPDC006257]|uniref:hypothetical protein n=1 Tax=Kribbella sp. NPDC006257 TaxID=3156738 RepID=UPI0033A8E68E
MRVAPVVLIVLALLGAGCSSNTPAADGPPTTPTPAATPTPKPTPKVVGRVLPVKITGPGQQPLQQADTIGQADRDAAMPPSRQIMFNMIDQTDAVAGYKAAGSVECPGDGPVIQPDAQTQCSVRYRNLKVRWIVRIDSNSDRTGRWVIYFLSPLDAVLLRKAVYNRFWTEFHTKGTELRCGQLPEIQRVKVYVDTKNRCQYLPPADSDGVRQWQDVKVWVGDSGVRVDYSGPPAQ